MQLIPGEVDATDALGFAGEDSLGDRRWAEVCAVDLHESAPSVFLDVAGVIAWRRRLRRRRRRRRRSNRAARGRVVRRDARVASLRAAAPARRPRASVKRVWTLFLSPRYLQVITGRLRRPRGAPADFDSTPCP